MQGTPVDCLLYANNYEEVDETHPVIERFDHVDDCLLYTSDAADDLLCVDLGGRRIIKKKNINTEQPIVTVDRIIQL